MDAVTKSLAKELGARNIRVNSINPGMVVTEGVQAAGFLETDLRKQLDETTTRLKRVEDEGKVAESGTHDQLLAAGGLYARLVSRQLASAYSAAAQ